MNFNNVAQRAIRPAALWRKGSFGTDSESGSRFVERILTVVTTNRLPGSLSVPKLPLRHSTAGRIAQIGRAHV